MNRNIKLLLILLFSTFIVFVLYQKFYNPKKYLTVLGDSVSYGMTVYQTKGYSFNDYLLSYLKDKKIYEDYNDDFSIPNLTSYELLNLIIKNETKDDLTIKQAIGKADIITISIGNDELLTGGNINLYLYSMDNIIKEITAINKNKIFLVGLYINNIRTKDINNSLKMIAKKYNVEYIDISDIDIKDNLFENSEVLNYKGHLQIFKKIILKIDC